jgi:hypothetical protein
VVLEPCSRSRFPFPGNVVSSKKRESATPDSGESSQRRPRRRQPRRDLRCPAHPEQELAGGGRRYFLHLLRAEELIQRGMPPGRSRLVIAAYPVLTLSNEWLEELFCQKCGLSRWCHVTRHDRVEHSVRWAPPELWQQVAHVDPLHANPSVSEFSRRQAGRRDTRRYWDP